MVSEDDGPRGRSAPFPTPALGGHETENRHSEGARARPAGAADGLAVRQARRPDPKQAARGTEGDTPADPRDGSLRNAQPPGGPDPWRPCRRAGTCASQGQGGGGGHLRTQSRLGLRLAHHHRRRTRLRRGPTFFTNDAGDFLPAPVLLAGLLTIAFAGILVEATFRLLERGTVARWGMKVGRE